MCIHKESHDHTDNISDSLLGEDKNHLDPCKQCLESNLLKCGFLWNYLPNEEVVVDCGCCVDSGDAVVVTDPGPEVHWTLAAQSQFLMSSFHNVPEGHVYS